MSKDFEEFREMLDGMIENVTDVLEKAKVVSALHEKFDQLLAGKEFSVKMSVISMALAKAILDEADDYNEAYCYVARIGHTLVDVLDRHKAKQMAEDAEEKDEPVH